ncbi:MAG: hypothetical protein NT038_01080 [Euryarchaeota archaeon]|nr:hypothetical protein [Euryarchaeota archaeon]
MTETKTYEKFPSWIPLLAITDALCIYLVGAIILSGFGIITSFLYIIYCGTLEIIVLRRSCINCYYYGKLCGLGKGKICPYFFKKGASQRFIERKISWFDLLPDFLTFIIPLIGGIILLYLRFSWLILGAMVLIFILSLGGNMVIRGSFACKYCKQRELGCPADRLFNKKTKENST